MKIHRINAVIVRHLYESRRNFDRVIDMVWWPVLDIIMWGFFTIYLAHSSRLQPSVVSCLLGAVILWGTFYSFQRDMAVGFIDELWCRNLINLFSTPLTLSEYMVGLIGVCLLKVMVGLCAASADGVGGVFLRHRSVAAEVHPLHGEPVVLRARAGNRDHRADLSLHDENPGPGVELCGPAHAGVVRDVSDVVAAEVAARDRMDAADGAFVRRDAPGFGRQRILAATFLVGRRA